MDCMTKSLLGLLVNLCSQIEKNLGTTSGRYHWYELEVTWFGQLAKQLENVFYPVFSLKQSNRVFLDTKRNCNCYGRLNTLRQTITDWEYNEKSLKDKLLNFDVFWRCCHCCITFLLLETFFSQLSAKLLVYLMPTCHVKPGKRQSSMIVP